jgi:hypothetical protein
MSTPIHRPTPPLPLLMTELAFASGETIIRRSLLMASGTCTRMEYTRMVLEKMAAFRGMAAQLAQPWMTLEMCALLAPWHSRATANARRLRR